jgi:hypothetical protein
VKNTAAADQRLRDLDQGLAELGQYPHDDTQLTGSRNDRSDRERVHHRPPPTMTDVVAVIGVMLCA